MSTMTYTAQSLTGTVWHRWVRPLAWLRLAQAVHRERHRLSQLESHRLDDLGLSASAAWEEGNRPFWELPDERRW